MNSHLFLGDAHEDSINHVAEEEEEESRADPGEDDEAEGEVGADVGAPDGVEGVLQLDAALAHVEDEEAGAAEEDDGQLAPVGDEAVLLARARPGGVDAVLAGEDHPEGHQGGVENALLDVVEEGEPGHVEAQREVLQGQV